MDAVNSTCVTGDTDVRGRKIHAFAALSEIGQPIVTFFLHARPVAQWDEAEDKWTWYAAEDCSGASELRDILMPLALAVAEAL